MKHEDIAPGYRVAFRELAGGTMLAELQAISYSGRSWTTFQEGAFEVSPEQLLPESRKRLKEHLELVIPAKRRDLLRTQVRLAESETALASLEGKQT